MATEFLLTLKLNFSFLVLDNLKGGGVGVGGRTWKQIRVSDAGVSQIGRDTK